MSSLDLLDPDEHAWYQFGRVKVHQSEVFARTHLSLAFTNIKPLVPGHVLLSPVRPVQRLKEMTAMEVSDLFVLVQYVGSVVQQFYHASALTIAMQDGPAAGQTVSHVHVHILPRRAGDFNENGQHIESDQRGFGASCWIKAATAIDDIPPRSLTDRREEADQMRALCYGK